MSATNLSDLQGQIERITYVNEENSYTVAKVKVYGRRELVTVIGNIVNPTPGEVIKMKGEWGNHPKFGEQFKIVFCQTTTPATVYGIEKYLGSGLVKGIGPVMAKRIAGQLQDKGHVTRGWLGVTIQEVTPDLAKSFGLKENKGALVAQVSLGSPAEKAGIEQGDIILEFDGKKISESNDLSRIVASTPVGKMIALKLSREGKVVDRSLKVGEMDEKGEAARASSSHQSLGITVQNLTPEIAQGLGLKKSGGVVVTQVESGSPADEAGIQTGDVIREVNRKPVKNADDFIQKIEKTKGQDNILLYIQRGENHLFAAVKPN
jgi:serine protease Do